MQMQEVLKPGFVWPQLSATNKTDVIRELSHLMAMQMKGLDETLVADILLERERLGSTGIQDGIAIPHGKVPGLDKIVIACGRSAAGIDFDAHDGQPTRLFFLLLAPESAAGQHLKALARLSRLLKDSGFRENLVAAKDAAAMYSAIIEEDKKI